MFKLNINKFLYSVIFLPLSILAVELDSPAPPNDAKSAMYTLQALCERLTNGTTGTKRGDTFVEPPLGPITGVGCSLDDAMEAAPIEDNTHGALKSEVLLGKTFWGLRTEGTWGVQTGTLTTQTLTDTTVEQSAGIYDAFNLSIIDPDLIASNIKSGITIFGIGGHNNVVDTSSGNAVAGDIAVGKKAWVNGYEITGTASNAENPITVAETGQITCYDADGTSVSCFGTGQDGDKLAGTTWPNPRFIDNGNGTITDNLTNLIWLKNANCFNVKNWATALSEINNLSDSSCDLTDGSNAGDWRLPNWNELHSLIAAEYYDPALSNAMGTAQWTEGNVFSNVRSSFYWSSTNRASDPSNAWFVNLDNGYMSFSTKTSMYYVWPVRSRQ